MEPTAFVVRRRFPAYLVVASFFGGIGIFCVGAACAARGIPTAGRLIASVIAVAVALFLWRAWVAGNEADVDGVRVRRYCAPSRAVPLEQLGGFAVESNGNGGYYVACLDRRGRSFRTQGLAFGSRAAAEGQADRLDALVRRLRDAGDPSEP